MGKRSNANDAKDLVQEARETGMGRKQYLRRMNELARDAHKFGDEKTNELFKVRAEHDLPFREEKGW